MSCPIGIRTSSNIAFGILERGVPFCLILRAFGHVYAFVFAAIFVIGSFVPIEFTAIALFNNVAKVSVVLKPLKCSLLNNVRDRLLGFFGLLNGSAGTETKKKPLLE